jgi:hypothetical protein
VAVDVNVRATVLEGVRRIVQRGVLRTVTCAGSCVLVIAACTDVTDSSTAVDSVFTISGRALPPANVNAYLEQHLGFTSRGGQMRCAYVPLGNDADRVFVNTACMEFVRAGDTLATGSGRGGPVALRVAIVGDSAAIVGHEVSQDGGGYSESVRRIFPEEVAERIFDAPVPDTLRQHLRRAAAARLGLPQR